MDLTETERQHDQCSVPRDVEEEQRECSGREQPAGIKAEIKQRSPNPEPVPDEVEKQREPQRERHQSRREASVSRGLRKTEEKTGEADAQPDEACDIELTCGTRRTWRQQAHGC